MRRIFLLFVLVAFGILLGGNGEALAKVIATITEDVQTEFGTYHPYPVQITPRARSYRVAEDFSNVGNFSEFGFSAKDRLLLGRNLFVVKPGPSVEDYGESGLYIRGKVIYEIYQDCKDREIPIFVTADAMLHTFHILYDYALRALEVERFADNLDRLNKALVAETERQIASSNRDPVQAILRKNLAFFSVAASLKDETFAVPPSVAELVEAELALIEAHEGFAPSPIFRFPSEAQVSPDMDYLEDYSQYVPRGHYTRNETLKTYFQSMMWYGRMAFRVEPDSVGVFKEKGVVETYQAILIVKALSELTVNGRPALEVWHSMYDPTVFFVGRSDDLNVEDYRTLIARIYGENWQSLSPDALYDRDKLLAFVAEAKKLRNPLINSSWVLDVQDPKKATKSFRFMGQRFIPDSYMLWQLVYTNVGTQGTPRLMPKGLDVMAILGSERALEHLIELYDQDRYAHYGDQMAKLKAEFEALAPEVWAQNLYWNWLYALMPLLEEKGAGYPPFMQNKAWTDRQLNSALGSWTELRHDTILYAKQSYTATVTEAHTPPIPSSRQGTVEPIPEVFGRLASLAGLMKEGLASRDLLLNVFAEKLASFERLQLHLKEIAEKELSNEHLSSQDFERIATIGDAMEEILTFPKEYAEAWESDTDRNMALVADVHTDPNTKMVLEEAVGYPAEMYVIVEVEGRLKVTKGALFTYYEFVHPMNDRLTDEAWQEKLAAGDVPDAPKWTASFQDIGARSGQEGYAGGEEKGGLAIPQVEVDTFRPLIGEEVEITFRANYPLEGNPQLEITPPGRERFSVEMEPLAGETDAFRYMLHTEGWEKGDAQVVARASYRSGQPRSVLSEMRYDLLLDIGGRTDVEEIYRDIPLGFELDQNFPNPFNPCTTIRFTVPEMSQGGNVNLTIYDLLGRKVRTLMDAQVGAGGYETAWDGKDGAGKVVSSGVYLYRLTVDGGRGTETRKMVLVR